MTAILLGVSSVVALASLLLLRKTFELLRDARAHLDRARTLNIRAKELIARVEEWQ